METCSGVKVMIRDLASGKEGEPPGPYEGEGGCTCACASMYAGHWECVCL